MRTFIFGHHLLQQVPQPGAVSGSSPASMESTCATMLERCVLCLLLLGRIGPSSDYETVVDCMALWIFVCIVQYLTLKIMYTFFRLMKSAGSENIRIAL